MDFLKSRLSVWVVIPTKRCDLAYSDLLIYSALCSQDQFGKHPTANRLAWLTGLVQETAAHSLERLEETGLCDRGRPVFNKDCFRLIKRPSADHWSKRYVRWQCLVRANAPDGLTVPDAMIYSFFLHNARNAYEPPGGWTCSNLGENLGMDRKTVSRVIDRLIDAELLANQDGNWAVAHPDELRGAQLEWFRRRSEPKKPRSIVFFSPQNPPLDLSEAPLVEDPVTDCLTEVRDYAGATGKIETKEEMKALLNIMLQKAIVNGALVEDWRTLVDQELEALHADVERQT